MRQIIWMPVLILFSLMLHADPEKIASLSPNLTEMVFLLGQGDRLAGRSVHCDYPEEAKKIKVVGSFGKAFPERRPVLRCCRIPWRMSLPR